MSAEQRRAPRTTVDVEARLRLYGQSYCSGLILNLSFAGSLFLPERPLDVRVGGVGLMRFAMPTSLSWLEPRIIVRRGATFTRAGGEQAQAIGFEFFGLSHEEERAIAAGCLEWETHRDREYPLSARCYMQGEGGLRGFSRYGRPLAGSRDHVRVSLPAGVELASGAQLRLKVATVAVSAIVDSQRATAAGSQALLRFTPDWGRDFFLHEARRQPLAFPLRRPPNP